MFIAKVVPPMVTGARNCVSAGMKRDSAATLILSLVFLLDAATAFAACCSSCSGTVQPYLVKALRTAAEPLLMWFGSSNRSTLKDLPFRIFGLEGAASVAVRERTVRRKV